MRRQRIRLLRLVESMQQECDAWRKFAIGLMVVGGALAFSVWATVRDHPEQDLPLWPAWIFAALGGVGLVLTVATLLHVPPFRPSRPHRNS
jgi:hypothetical protein